jgi:Ser/Thr protein kinase RdoA (MazF antagonist)
LGEKDLEAYEGLTHRGKMRRMRRVAREAIDAFGFTGAKLRLIADAGNITYRVKAGDQPGVETENDIYEDNCYLLRLHQPGYQTSGNIASELQWLSALCDENLPAPMPILAVDREMSVEVSVPGVPGVRRCSLLRWVKGRMATKLVRPGHMKAIGRLIARLHIHASSWRPASGFVRRHYDRSGLLVDDTGTNYTASEV